MNCHQNKFAMPLSKDEIFRKMCVRQRLKNLVEEEKTKQLEKSCSLDDVLLIASLVFFIACPGAIFTLLICFLQDD